MFHETLWFGGIAELILAIFQTIPIILAGGILYEYRQKVRASRLRSALLTEINEMEVEFTPLVPEGNAFLEGTIYKSNGDKLDLLSDTEIEALIRYYSQVSALRQVVERGEGQVEPSDVPKRIYQDAIDSREAVISELSDNLQNPPTFTKPSG